MRFKIILLTLSTYNIHNANHDKTHLYNTEQCHVNQKNDIIAFCSIAL